MPAIIGAIALAAIVLIVARINFGPRAAVSSPVGIETLLAESGRLVAFRSREPGPTDRHLAVVPAGDPARARAHFQPSCDRIAASRNYVVCLGRSANPLRPYQATLFGKDLKAIATVPVQGVPSRTRVSPDEKYFATTSFVAGDSYASELFSTRTFVYRISADEQTVGEGENLEAYKLLVNGAPYNFADKNLWGVTFVTGQDRFFATVSFNGHRYLADADIPTRTMVALRDNVECPSLSPNGLKLAYKKRLRDGQIVTWGFYVLDLLSNRETALGERRSVDDQIAWLDDDHVLYAVAREGAAGSDIWKAPVAGGNPELFIPNADSPTIIDRAGGDV